MGNKAAKAKAEADGVPLEHDDSSFTEALRVHLSRLIVYAEGSDPILQREVAETLANEAVKPERQTEIVDLGGLRLLREFIQQKALGSFCCLCRGRRVSSPWPHTWLLSPALQCRSRNHRT
jgi:hypothetical protein